VEDPVSYIDSFLWNRTVKEFYKSDYICRKITCCNKEFITYYVGLLTTASPPGVCQHPKQIPVSNRYSDKNSSDIPMILNCRYHVYRIIVSDISLKIRCFGLHFCRRMFTFTFNHFYAMRPGS